MANVIINDTNLTNIANAIREKNGTSETYKPNQMAAAILAIQGGGGGDTEWPTELSVYLGSFNMNQQLDTILTLLPPMTLIHNPYAVSSNQSNVSDVINNSRLEDLSKFTFIVSGSIVSNINNWFYKCNNLKKLPDIRLYSPQRFTGVSGFFYEDYSLNEIDKYIFRNKNTDGTLYDDNSFIFSTSSTINLREVFYRCATLRELPYFPAQMPISNFSATCRYCYGLKEIVDLPVPTNSITSNLYSNTFEGCSAARRFTFATQADGSPYTANMKGVTLDLSSGFGFSSNGDSQFTGYNNSVITEDMIVGYGVDGLIDTHNAQTKYPDTWVATSQMVSPYGHNAMVETINSLPDTSAAGTNTIKFKVNQGKYNGIDGGANLLTEEEIAVAAAKGWTVTFA